MLNDLLKSSNRMMLCYSPYVVGIFWRKLTQYMLFIHAHIFTFISIITYNCRGCKYNNLSVIFDSFKNISLSIVCENVCFSNNLCLQLLCSFKFEIVEMTRYECELIN